MIERICPQCGMRTQEPTCPTHHCPTVVQVSGGLETLPRGAVVGGRYRIVRQIGKGGFGAVYLASHQATQQELVLKVLKPDLSEDPTQVQRFFNEARASSQLSHPHTVRVFDFGQTDSGLLYIAMERLHGKELAHALKESGGTLAPMRAVRIAIGVLKSLAEAHHAGLVHRDLKPDNIFLCRVHGEDEFVKVIDFGIAKPKDSGDQNLTRTGFTVGTPKYMSPEQVLNKPLDGRSDLYALGVILYQALCGEVPLVGASPMETLMAHLQKEPVDLRERAPHLPPMLTRLVMRTLRKQPWERFTDADHMREALEEVLVVLEAADPVLRARSSRRIAAVKEAELQDDLAPQSAAAPPLQHNGDHASMAGSATDGHDSLHTDATSGLAVPTLAAEAARLAELRGQLTTTEREMPARPATSPARGPAPAKTAPAASNADASAIAPANDPTAALPRPALPAAPAISPAAAGAAPKDRQARAQQETTLLSTPKVVQGAKPVLAAAQPGTARPLEAQPRPDAPQSTRTKVVWPVAAVVMLALGTFAWWQTTTQSAPVATAAAEPALATAPEADLAANTANPEAQDANPPPPSAGPADTANNAQPAVQKPESGAEAPNPVALEGEAALQLLAPLDGPVRRCAAGRIASGDARWMAVVRVSPAGRVTNIELEPLGSTPDSVGPAVAACVVSTAPDPGLGAGPPRFWKGQLPVALPQRAQRPAPSAADAPQLAPIPAPRRPLPSKPRAPRPPKPNGDENM